MARRWLVSMLAVLGTGLFVGRAAGRTTPDHLLCGTEILARRFSATMAALAESPREEADRSGRAAVKSIGESEVFWSANVSTNSFFQTRATLRKVGVHCYIYVEDGHAMSDETVEKLAKQFDTRIYPTDRRWFGSEWTPGIDGDARITLLFLDIQDGWEPGKGYVGGYFFPLDEVSTRLFPQSNEREIVYLDINPGDPRREDYLGVLAHEFQHMIHFNQDPRETKWLNEAFAQIAFLVCGYGHAPQVFHYLRNTDVDLTDFQNSLENYGAAYLWTYYLFLHHAGSTDEARAAFFREITASTLMSMDSISDALRGRGISRSIGEIFTDWTVANAACDPASDGGRFGYGDDLRLGVNNPAQTYLFNALPGSMTSATVHAWAADYIAVHRELPWSPVHPTMVDKVLLKTAIPGSIRWRVNGTESPPARLVPAGSTLHPDGTVSTPVTRQEDGSLGVVIGPFHRLGTVIRSLRFVAEPQEGTPGPVRELSIFSIDSLAQPSIEIPREQVSDLDEGKIDHWILEFQGEKSGWFGGRKEFRVNAVIRRGGVTEVTEFALDSENRLHVPILDSENLDAITFVITGIEGKNLEYAYRVIAPPSRRRAALVSRGERLLDLQQLVEEQLVDDPTERARALATIERGLDALRDELGTSGSGTVEPRRIERQARQVHRFHETSASRFGFTVPTALSPMMRPPAPEDQAHDNLLYILMKNRELIHALTHLMIDPQLLEGQIFKMWKLLEITRGFPHLPLPDGLGIRDFDLGAVDGLVSEWARRFDLPLPVGPEDPSLVSTDPDQEQVKEVAKRMWLAESIVEHAYNSGLVLGQDFTLTTIYFVKFVLGVKRTLGMIADGLSGVPVVGDLARRAKVLMVSKLLRIISSLVVMVSSRLDQPYASLVPIGVQFITDIVARTYEVPSDGGDFLGWTKEYILGLAGKYLLTAAPVIGYVDRGQIAVDTVHRLGSMMIAKGTYAEAHARVWDNGSPGTTSSMREKIDTEVTARHANALRSQQIAWVTGKLGEIARIGTLLDPTSIARIVAVGLEVLTAGIWVQSAWTTGSYFFRLPRHDALRGVMLAFRPGVDPALEPGAQEGYRISGSPRASQIERLQEDVEDAIAEFLHVVQAEAADAASDDSFDRIAGADRALDRAIERAEGILYGSMVPDDGSRAAREEGEALEGYHHESVALDLQRIALLGDHLARRMGVGSPERTASPRERFERYLTALRHALDRTRARDTSVEYLRLDEVSTRRDGNHITLKVVVENPNDKDLPHVEVRLYSGADFEVEGGDSRIIPVPAGETREVTFEIELTADPGYGATVTILPSAEGVKGLPSMTSLE